MEQNDQLLKEEKRKSAQAWTLLSSLEDDHSISQMKLQELRFHYDLKCEELKNQKTKNEQLVVQLNKLEGNYNFVLQEKIALQREAQELKKTLELKEAERQKKCCCIQ